MNIFLVTVTVDNSEFLSSIFLVFCIFSIKTKLFKQIKRT